MSAAFLALAASPAVLAEPSATGQTGLINMPDARIDPDGTWRIGVSNADPYLAGWTSISALPRLELSGRYTRIGGVAGFGGQYAASYGAYKDKAFDAKLLLLPESEHLPALVLGAQDFLGTRLFGAEYLAAGKRFGRLDASLGVGRGRIDGVFGGARYYLTQSGNLAFVAEYDANSYRHDPSALQSGAAERKKGASYGLEYKWGWLGAQASYQRGELGLNGYVAIPLSRKEFIPKIDEPEPYTKITPRPTSEQWERDPAHKLRMVEALFKQDYKNIRIRYTGYRLEVSLTNSRISQMSRAVGRAARTVLLLSPIETREISITYTSSDLPVATYTFFEVNKLQRYFNGLISRKELAQYVSLAYPAPVKTDPGHETSQMLSALDEGLPLVEVAYNEGGNAILLRREDSLLNSVRISPKLAFYFNDPSGAFRYNIFARATVDRHLGDKLFLNVAVDGALLEDVSKVSNPSNSELPHVRTDVADYKRDSKLKLSTVLLNKYYHPAERVYTRASAGLYEEMYGGAGGQVLYVPRGGSRWAADVGIDWLRQRDTYGGFGFRRYSTVTALGAVHYRFSRGVTATVRAGRFLAKDVGARFELKRRFSSGFEMGAWYTFTNGNDVTSPGTPDNPYRDKGIFLSMAIDAMVTKDTQARANFAIAPWTRDVGQMVVSPGDLYDMLEKPLMLDFGERDGLVRFGDVDDNYDLPPRNAAVF